jgi:hypothetical protein
VPPVGDVEPLQWSAQKLRDVLQRGTLAILRSEVIACPSSQFVNFMLRPRRLHPDECDEDGLTAVLTKLEGHSLPARLWEQAILPSRACAVLRRVLLMRSSPAEWRLVMPTRSAADVVFYERDAFAALHGPHRLEHGRVDRRVFDSLRAVGRSSCRTSLRWSAAIQQCASTHLGPSAPSDR